MKIVDISYYYNDQATDPAALVKRHSPSMGYLEYFPESDICSAVKFMNYEGNRIFNKVNYYFFKGSHSRAWLPWKQHAFLRRLQPDVIVTHGLIFPLQVILLRTQMGKKTKIFIQYHADKPGKRVFQKFQAMADRCVDGYLFSARELALPWLQSCVIKDNNKIFEVKAGSTYFKKKDKRAARKFTGVPDGVIFLWVGRLDENKDPLTVVKAFLQFAKDRPDVYLFMIYQNDDMPGKINQLLSMSNFGNQPIRLVGAKPHDELENWYNSADYFLSGSHNESYGYALCEAMACGCIPVVTDIPSFRQITNRGEFGQLYAPGNVAALLQALNSLDFKSREISAQSVASHFEKELSFQAIANKIYEIGNRCR